MAHNTTREAELEARKIAESGRQTARPPSIAARLHLSPFLR